MSDPSNTSLEHKCYTSSQPVNDPIWRGSFSICDKKFSIIPGAAAHLSNNTCLKACEAVTLLPALLQMQMLPRLHIWPQRFRKSPPTDDNVALYFLPDYESDKEMFKYLLDYVSNGDLAMKAIVAENIELLIFSSLQLLSDHQRHQNKTYLWGVFRRKHATAFHHMGDYPLIQDSNNVEFLTPSSPAIGVDVGKNTSQMKIRNVYNLRSSAGNCEPTKKLLKRGRKPDIAWEHAIQLKGSKNEIACKYCAHAIARGKIIFLKQHLAGEGPKACPKVPREVEIAMKEALQSKYVKKLKKAPLKKEVKEAEQEKATKTSVHVENGAKGMYQKEIGADIPRAAGTEETIDIVLQEIVHAAVETFMNRELEQHGALVPSAKIPEQTAVNILEPALAENQTKYPTDPTQLGNQIIPAVCPLDAQPCLLELVCELKGPQAITDESTLDTTVPRGIPSTASVQTVRETIATTSEVVLENMYQHNGERESSCSLSQRGSQSTGVSVLHILSDFDKSVSVGETDSEYNSAEQVGKYLIKPSLAPILRSIIDKHGDIAHDCLLTPGIMLTSALEELCIAVQNLQSMQFSDLQDHHLESLRYAINDAELVKLDVKWLRSYHDDLVKDMHLINEYKYVKDARSKILKLTESAKRTLDLKVAEMMNLQDEIDVVESNLSLAAAETKKLKCSMRNAKSKFMPFSRKCLMDGLL